MDKDLVNLLKNLSEDSLADFVEGLPPIEREVLLNTLHDYEKALDRERSQKDFMAYVKAVWPGFIPGRHHSIISEKFAKIASGEKKRLIICLPPRHALTLTTKVPTTNGWTTIANLHPGDYVFGPDGLPTKVLGKSKVFKNQQIYRVHTDDGAYIDVDGEHLWTVRLDRKFNKYHTYTTQDLYRRQAGEVVVMTKNGPVFRKTKTSKTVRKPRLPEVQPVQYPEQNLPIDPYVLGIWLGDGHSSQAVITCSDEDAKIIRPEIERRGYKTTDQATPQTYGILDLKVKLRNLGLLGDKRIPSQYLIGSEQQRRDLLKGLMDTDGNISKKGQCYFAQSNRAFITQVAELVASLGVKVSILESEAKIGDKSYGPTWKLSFYAQDIAFLPRKESRTIKAKRFGRYIWIEKLDQTADTQCIQVEREDGLFLAGKGYIVTHNTKSEFGSYLLPAWFLGRYPEKKIIQCSNTAELAVGFGRKVRNLVDSDLYSQIFPDVKLRVDSKAAGRWSTNKNGEYFAIGVGGTVTGKGADLLIIDDPHALEVSTPIPTPNGFVPLGQLQVGDEVYGPDGLPTKVVAKSDVYENRPLFEVKTSDGEVIFADAKHLWSVRTSTRVDDSYHNITSDNLVNARSSAFMIPRHSAVQYPTRELLIDPWVLGAWLGDGTSSLGRMTAHPDDMPYMRGEFHRRGYETTDLTDKYSFGVKGLRSKLIELGVLNNKHIPHQYMIADIFQRKALLQGLMDTDGNVTQSGQCVFHNKDPNLVDQVVELLRSLGRKCQRRSYQTKNSKFGDCVMHRVTFKLKKAALMPRKSIRTKTTHDKQHRSITVVQTERTGSVQCITVEREDGLFLAGRGYVVTHNSEQEAASAVHDPKVYDKVYEWYTSGPRQRLQPGGAIVVIMTRWGKRDLVGQVLKAAAQRGGEDWEVVEFPAIMPSGKPLWPEFWSLKELEALREELPNAKWQAQYQQNPVSEESAVIKREWWKQWEYKEPPECDFVLQAWDTAFEKHNRADYSACTTWGVFYQNDDNGEPQANIILLNAVRERVEFPQLKKMVLREYKEWEPDSVVIEKKASGAPLIYELRAMGVMVQEFTPVKGNDKINRLNAVSDIFASGRVWAPVTSWAEEVIDEVAGFPNSEHDDYVDTVSLALMRFRKGGYIRAQLDQDDEPSYTRRRQAYY